MINRLKDQFTKLFYGTKVAQTTERRGIYEMTVISEEMICHWCGYMEAVGVCENEFAIGLQCPCCGKDYTESIERM
jgi:hypothetical protein